MDKTKTRQAILMLVSLAVLSAASIGVTSAYLSRDPGSAINVVTVGSINIDLEEKTWKEEKNLHPRQSIPKDPVVTNTGENDCWAFLEVKIPVRQFRIVENKRKGAMGAHELFTFESDSTNWEQVSRTVEGDYAVYVYGYKKILKPGEKTSALFTAIKAVNYLEGDLDAGEDYSVPVTAQAIQSNVNAEGLENVYASYLAQVKAGE